MNQEYLRQYKKVRCIGRGKFGTAYLVLNNEDNQHYVAKKIQLGTFSSKEVDNALMEANLLKGLHNSHIVSYKNSFCANSELIIVMEYCESKVWREVDGDLATVIEKRKKSGAFFSESEVMNIFLQICIGLNYIHSSRILHRDLKPQNLFLTSGNRVKIGDFGISKVLQGTLESAITMIGTPYYISPEICKHHPYTLKSDIWSLGCILYELATLEVLSAAIVASIFRRQSSHPCNENSEGAAPAVTG